MYHISNEKNVDIQQLMQLMKQTYWAPECTEGEVLTAIHNSICFSAFDNSGKLVGFARVVTDFVSIWYLCDVIVDESHRGKGIGKRLLSAIVSDARFSKVPALLKTKDANGLYRKYGFADADAGRVMYRPKQNL